MRRSIRFIGLSVVVLGGVFAVSTLSSRAAPPAAASPASAAAPASPAVQSFISAHCVDCHDADSKKGNLDLTALKYDPASPQNMAAWVKVHDRVVAGEMPPKKKPPAAEQSVFVKSLSASLTAADASRTVQAGRATQRRLNRYEYENAVRDLLGAPWLALRDTLPEDGESHRFNKIGEALDVSHVQVSRYLSTADQALRDVMATQAERPKTETIRYYTRDQSSFVGKMKFSVFNRSPERATFPVLGTAAQPDVRALTAPISVGKKDPKTRELEGMGVVASTYEPLEIKFNKFEAPVSGRYKLRFKTWTVWVGPGKGNKWWVPDLDNVAPGRRDEPVTIYGETPPRLLRRLGTFDAKPEAGVAELDVQLLEGETIRPDAVRLFRSRPSGWQNPLAEKDGCPGVVFGWLEVEGPIYDQWPSAGHKLMFGDLPLKKTADGIEAVSQNPKADAQKLLTGFMTRAYRRPVEPAEVARFTKVIDAALASGSTFTDAMIAGYTGVLCSPEFICVEEKPGKLDDFAVATRLSLFLWNTAPDDTLRQLAAKGKLRKPGVLAAQVDRLLADPRSRQFVEAFLDYWLDLRKIEATSPDSILYPDYYLDDLLVESAKDETHLFFTEMLKADLPARNVVASDFAMLNERLAKHYGIEGVQGVALRKVALPKGSPRGGIMTQASVLKVTANGTTTSPVLRGVWVMERILGMPPPPPPPSVPAVEPDIRGAVTIRQQLDKHRDIASCAACHVKIDPAGFALESFDVLGGWRDKYRAVGDGAAETGFGKNGQKFTFHKGPAVDASGQLPDGRKFADVIELKRQLLTNERQIARNLASQFIVYATGAPIGFGDRAKVEAILDRTAPKQFGTRSLIHAIVESELFLNK
ncbi:DUF1592 domain-containing protein [Humisphaera borealis]|uniref:DUF1592 domain-containing protein n=1 Tax=Humisphaera borealis TaxID=2807512 RepID=A0A7M2X091_9BACT|nr:DUF1592 domain-containing protein [Humisphaera borealis]QOV91115.1 DUF1592 domain-containing protein [Humisphaera borealis]